MLKTILALTVASLVSGCAVPAVAVIAGTRDATMRHAGLILAQMRPELPNTAASVCVVNGMSRAEVFRFGSSDTTVITAAHQAKIAEVMARPKVTSCLAGLVETAA